MSWYWKLARFPYDPAGLFALLLAKLVARYLFFGIYPPVKGPYSINRKKFDLHLKDAQISTNRNKWSFNKEMWLSGEKEKFHRIMRETPMTMTDKYRHTYIRFLSSGYGFIFFGLALLIFGLLSLADGLLKSVGEVSLLTSILLFCIYIVSIVRWKIRFHLVRFGVIRDSPMSVFGRIWDFISAPNLLDWIPVLLFIGLVFPFVMSGALSTLQVSWSGTEGWICVYAQGYFDTCVGR